MTMKVIHIIRAKTGNPFLRGRKMVLVITMESDVIFRRRDPGRPKFVCNGKPDNPNK